MALVAKSQVPTPLRSVGPFQSSARECSGAHASGVPPGPAAFTPARLYIEPPCTLPPFSSKTFRRPRGTQSVAVLQRRFHPASQTSPPRRHAAVKRECNPSSGEGGQTAPKPPIGSHRPAVPPFSPLSGALSPTARLRPSAAPEAPSPKGAAPQNSATAFTDWRRMLDHHATHAPTPLPASTDGCPRSAVPEGRGTTGQRNSVGWSSRGNSQQAGPSRVTEAFRRSCPRQALLPGHEY